MAKRTNRRTGNARQHGERNTRLAQATNTANLQESDTSNILTQSSASQYASCALEFYRHLPNNSLKWSLCRLHLIMQHAKHMKYYAEASRLFIVQLESVSRKALLSARLGPEIESTSDLCREIKSCTGHLVYDYDAMRLSKQFGITYNGEREYFQDNKEVSLLTALSFAATAYSNFDDPPLLNLKNISVHFSLLKSVRDTASHLSISQESLQSALSNFSERFKNVNETFIYRYQYYDKYASLLSGIANKVASGRTFTIRDTRVKRVTATATNTMSGFFPPELRGL